MPGNLADTDLLARESADTDGVIHAASPGDSTHEDVGKAVLDAVLDTVAGSGKPCLHTSGVWVHGSDEIDEDTPLDPPPLTAWRQPFDERITSAGHRLVSAVR